MTILVAIGIDPGAAHAQALSITTTPVLYPGFDVGITDYVVRCTEATPVHVTVDAPPGTDVAVDDQAPQSGTFSADVRLTSGQSFAITTSSGGSTTGTYYVRCLPPDFWTWTSQLTGTPQAEWYILGAFNPAGGTGNYVGVFDTHGVPVWWYRSTLRIGYPLLLPNGTIGWSHNTSTVGPEVRRLDGWIFRNVNAVGAGVSADFHEFLQLPNGNYLVAVTVNRPGFNVCGRPNSTVVDTGIQEIAPNGSAVWTWWPSEHIPTSEIGVDWCPNILATPFGGSVYDPWHFNSAEPDGNGFVLSFRHLDAIYRIDKTTGDVDWKLGGTSTPQSLTILNDPNNGPWGGHDARVLSDGTVTSHDNGFHPAVQRTPRATRYEIDTLARTATLVEQVNDPGTVTSGCCGSARKLPGGNWVMSWGNNPLVTELTPSGSRVFSLTLPAGRHAYRAYPVLPGVLSRALLRAGMDAQFPRYGRPATGTPLRIPLVAAYAECTTPNTTHVAPLALDACDPPVEESGQLTTSRVGIGHGSVKLTAVVGNPATAADEGDVRVSMNVSDVRRRTGGDYTGNVILQLGLRETDVANNPFGLTAATTQDSPLSIPVSCTSTPSPTAGGTCAISTTLDTLVPGTSAEGKKAIMSLPSIRVLDAGADGDITPPSGSCPYTCGSGDEQVFLRQGLYAP